MKRKNIIIASILFYTFVLSQDAICQWLYVSPPLYVHCLYVDGSTLYAGAIDSGAVWYSSDNGITWKNKTSVHDGVFAIAKNDNFLFAGTYTTGIWRTADNGKTWINMSKGLKPGISINCLLSNGSSIFAATMNGVARTDNDGVSWSQVLSIPMNVSESSSLVLSRTSLFVATDKGVFRTTDNGDNWQLVRDSLTTGIGSIDSIIFCSTYIGLYRSTNNGADWTIDSNGIGGRGMHLFRTEGNNIFASNGSGNTTNIFLSTNSGLLWTDLGQVHRLESLCISGPNLIAGSSNTGIWYRPLSGILNAIKNPTQSDLTISLSPNPTTGILSIRNAPEDLTGISILNVLGEKVKEISAPHSAEFTLDLSKLPPGIYFARFALAGEVVSRKIIKE